MSATDGKQLLRSQEQGKWPDGIRAEYLAQSGAASFDPVGFLNWLQENPDHVAYSLGFDEDGEPLDNMPLIRMRGSRR